MSQVSAASFADVTPIESRRSANSLLLPTAELVAVLGLVEFDLWYLRGTDSPLLHAMVFSAIGLVIWCSYQRRRKSEPSATPFLPAARAWAEATALTLAITLVLIAAAWLLRDLDEGFRFYFRRRPFAEHFVWLGVRFAGAVVQQLGLQLLIGPACLEIVRSRRGAVCAAGLLFGILHLPHPILVAVTMIVGSLWVWLFQRSGRLAPVVTCHVVLSILAAGTLPRTVISDMDIGEQALNQMIHPRYICGENIREAVDLVKSRAYFDRQGGTGREFVEGVYRDFLGRQPTDDELDRWLTELSETSRARTARSIFNSKQFDAVHPRSIARRLRVEYADDLASDNPRESVRR